MPSRTSPSQCCLLPDSASLSLPPVSWGPPTGNPHVATLLFYLRELSCMDLTCCFVLSRQATSEEQHETLTATMSLCHSDCNPGDLVPLRSHITCSEKLLLMWMKGLEMQLISFGLSLSLLEDKTKQKISKTIVEKNCLFLRVSWKWVYRWCAGLISPYGNKAD